MMFDRIIKSCIGDEYKVLPVISRYLNRNIAIRLICEDTKEPFATLTVNLPDITLPEGYAFVDTNNIADARRYIMENELGEDTGIEVRSGYWIYPLYRFDMGRLKADD